MVSEKSTHSRFLWCGLGSWVTMIWALQGDLDGCIMSSFNICWICCFSNLRSALLYLQNLVVIVLQPGRRFSNSLTGDMEVAVRLPEGLSEASLLENLCLFLHQRFRTLRAGSGPPYLITTNSCLCWKSYPNMRSEHRLSIMPTTADWYLLPWNSISIVH